MQITGEIDWKEQVAEVDARALDQREEFGAVRSLTSKLSADRIGPDFHSERGMYLGMDEALSLQWESLTGRGQRKLSKSTDSVEFEFNMSGLAVDPLYAISAEGISPADDLFYKGQLLPLHLPKRLQMVQKLSSPKHSVDRDDSVTVSCLFQPGSLKCSSPGDDGYLGSALVNSRCSSFHSQGSNNFWESDSPNELDSGDSSSSRDSSGSSQDSVDVPQKQSLPKFNDHIAFQKEGTLFQQRDYMDCHNLRSSEKTQQFSSWLRTPFKWKVFFGLKKPSRSSTGDFSLEESVVRGSKGSFTSEFVSSATRPSAGPPNMRSPKGTYFSAEMKVGAQMEAFDDAEECRMSSGHFVGEESASPVDHEGLASKPWEILHKYFNMLKLSSVKAAASSAVKVRMKTSGQQSADTNTSSTRMLNAKSSFSGNLRTSTSPQQQLPSFSSSHVASPKAQSSQNSSSFVEPKSSSQHERPRPRSPSAYSFSGNLRVPSFSRASKASTHASNAIGKSASPHHSALLNHSPGAMTELHSAIQGAIAHCKQSQSVS